MEIVSYAMGEGAGYDEGYKAGEESSTAYQDGYNAGETAGYTSGYSAGYTDGAASITPSAKKLLTARDARNLFANKIWNNNTVCTTGVAVLADGVIKAAINYDDFAGCTNISGLFRGQYLTTEFPTFDTSNVTIAGAVFADCFEEEKTTGAGCTAPYLDLSKVTSIAGMFLYEHPSGSNRYSHLKAIPLYDVTSVTILTNLFKGCVNLESIPALNFSSIPVASTAFVNSGSNGWIVGCYSLKEINILDIHYNFQISASTQFTREALVKIIGNLRDMTGSTAKTLTMGSTNMAKLTTDDIAVATAKNWTIA